MKKVLSLLILSCCFLGSAQANVSCLDTIREVNNYSESEDLHVLLTNSTHYVKLESKTSISMALMAFASGKKIKLNMSESNITTCKGGTTAGSWGNGHLVSGWFQVHDL